MEQTVEKTEAAPAIDLESPELYINRELSLLEFNHRVLEQARNSETPLLERLRFLCISSTNMDEFFEIRVSGVIQQVEYGSVQVGPDGLSPHDQIERISERAHGLVAEQYRVLNEELIPPLGEENIRFVKRAQWNDRLRDWTRRHFNREVLPVLTPIGLDPAHPFPRILNKSLNFIVSLEGKDAFGRENTIAIVQAPRSLPRLIPIPKDYAKGPHDFVFLSSIIHAHVGELFPGMTVTGCYQFRVTRNSDLFVDEEEVDDLLHALAGELHSRRFSDAVRLEVADNCPEPMVDYLLREFELEDNKLYRVRGPVNLNRLASIIDLVDRPELKFPRFSPNLPQRVLRNENMFEVLKRGDLLLHHPFEAFTPVIDLVSLAATDQNVLAIKQTLYRTDAKSRLVDELVRAARAGKEVTVVIELRARFDEEANIALATRLQEAGAHVVYGVVGYKTHAKLLIIIRREGRTIKRYCHVGTGNYHAGTACMYTDYGLMTCDRETGEDVHKLFQQLTGLGKASKLKRILQSPFTLHKGMLEAVQQEIGNAAKGKPARIIAKMNSLVEPEIIRALYQASQAGIRVDLVVRGVCCLRPGIEGVSENIHVRSIVGRFLEHTRVFYFENGGDPLLYISSADWMNRNFFRRVEACTPVQDRKLAQRIYRELSHYLKDNTQAWQLGSDGRYSLTRPGRHKSRSAQRELLEKLGG